MHYVYFYPSLLAFLSGYDKSWSTQTILYTVTSASAKIATLFWRTLFNSMGVWHNNVLCGATLPLQLKDDYFFVFSPYSELSWISVRNYDTSFLVLYISKYLIAMLIKLAYWFALVPVDMLSICFATATARGSTCPVVSERVPLRFWYNFHVMCCLIFRQPEGPGRFISKSLSYTVRPLLIHLNYILTHVIFYPFYFDNPSLWSTSLWSSLGTAAGRSRMEINPKSPWN